MKISADTCCYNGVYSMKEAVSIMAEAGFDAVDFSFEPKYCNSEIPDCEHETYFAELKRHAEACGIYFNQAHAPSLSNPEDKEKAEKSFNDIVRSIKNASRIGAKILVVHPLDHINYMDDGAPEKLFELNMKFYRSLKPYCEEYDVRIGIENITNYRKINMLQHFRFLPAVCSSPEELIQYIDTLNDDCFVACLDIGHSIVANQNPATFIKKLGAKRLKALHVHDSNGYADSHTMPYLGGLGDWNSITKALHDIGYEGDFNFEAGNFLRPLPKELYPYGAKLLAETGKYLVRQIGL